MPQSQHTVPSTAAFIHAAPAGPKNDLLNGCLTFTVNALQAASKAQCALVGATLAGRPLPGPATTSAQHTAAVAAPPSSIPGAQLAHGMLHRAATFIRIACASDMAPAMHGSVPLFPLCDCPVLSQLPRQPVALPSNSPTQQPRPHRTPPRTAGRRRGSHVALAPGHEPAAVTSGARAVAATADVSPVLVMALEMFAKSAEECTGSARDGSDRGASLRSVRPSCCVLPASWRSILIAIDRCIRDTVWSAPVYWFKRARGAERGAAIFHCGVC